MGPGKPGRESRNNQLKTAIIKRNTVCIFQFDVAP